MSRASWFDRPLRYGNWIARFDAVGTGDRRAIRAHITRFTRRPRFHLLVTADEAGPSALAATLASLSAQLYRDFDCTVLDSAEEASSATKHAAGAETSFVPRQRLPGWLAAFNASLAGDKAAAWVMLLRAGDTLPPHALYWYACEILARPATAMVYSDDDSVDAQGRRCDPRFKPDWSPVHLRATNYVGEAACVRGAAAAVAGGLRLECCRHGSYDFLLRVADVAGDEIAHVPAVLFHRRYHPHAGFPGETRNADASAVRAHLERNGIAAVVEDNHTLPGCRRVRYLLPGTPPLVSLIVPTRDALSLIRSCVESVLAKTSYPRYEVLVVDNQSVHPETLAWFEEIAGRPGIRVLRYDRPFNYSAINNFAAREARGEMLCFLNNDTEVISPDWLEEMAGHLVQARVGAVGAKLLFPDGRVQHAGDAVGPRDCADHMHSGLERDAPGYCGGAAIAREVSAVTAACLLTWKRLYDELGGLNEKRLPIAFNDVDYCLRVQEAGYRVIFSAHAELYHHESATRGKDATLRRWLRARREAKYIRERWRQRLRVDPYYSPNLSYREPDFSLSRRPRVSKPWRRRR